MFGSTQPSLFHLAPSGCGDNVLTLLDEPALDDGPLSDKRLAALRELAALYFDLEVGYLSRDCKIELEPVVATSGLTVGDGIALMQTLLATGGNAAFEEARWIGEHIANGEALVKK